MKWGSCGCDLGERRGGKMHSVCTDVKFQKDAWPSNHGYSTTYACLFVRWCSADMLPVFKPGEANTSQGAYCTSDDDGP